MHGKLCLSFVPPDQTRSCHDVISIDTFLATIPDWERRHTAQPPDSRSAALHRIARGLIRSLDLNLWPGVSQGQGQGQEGMGQVAESQEIIAPVKHSHWHYDIRANQFLHRYFRKTTSTAFLLIQTSLNCRYGSPNVVDTALRMLRCRNLELLETLLPSLACQ